MKKSRKSAKVAHGPESRHRVSAAELTPKALPQRIQARMDELDTNAYQVGLKTGLNSTVIHAILSGQSKAPAVGVVRRIAEVLQCDMAYLVGDQPNPRLGPLTPVGEIPIIGYAEAGAFRPMVDVEDEDAALGTIAEPRSRQYPNARLFALRIMGDSMNAAKPRAILEGDVAICVDMASAGLEIETGQIYAIRRTSNNGQTWECTVKRAKVFKDRYELWPESTNERHQPIIIRRRPGAAADDGTTVEAIGLVYRVSYDFERSI